MHRRLVAIGQAAAAYGKFQAARDSFEAAGQWAELMPLCALQGDFDALRDYAARVSDSQVCQNTRRQSVPVVILDASNLGISNVNALVAIRSTIL